jgi:UDP-N-acetylmuramoyl-tripeptide--D-alanyl-D-alanine ligase
MIELSLADLASIVDGRLKLAGAHSPDTVVSGVVDTDSRLMTAGGIFIAKPGEVTDGHLYVGAAVQAGAAVAIVEREVAEAVTQIVVANVLDALASLAKQVVHRVRSKGTIRLVGITGSNGKTTTKNLVQQILAAEGESVAPLLSFNNEVGAPLTMLRITKETDYLVSEYGAIGPGAIGKLAALAPPDVAVILMVGKAHAGGYGSLAATAETKAGLIDQTRPGGTVVLNYDDPLVREMQDRARNRGLEVVWFGTSDAAEIRATDIEVSARGTSAVIHVDGEQLPIQLQIIGTHHIHNALAAIGATRALGISPQVAIERMQTLAFAERWRMQPMGNDQIRIYNDAYNASPDAMAAALRTLAQITTPDQRMVVVLGSMAELGELSDEEHDRIGLLAVRLNIPRIVIVGESARRMYLAAIGEGSWDGEAVFLPDADAAYEYLMKELRPGDRVLLKSSVSAGLRHLGDRLGESIT